MRQMFTRPRHILLQNFAHAAGRLGMMHDRLLKQVDVDRIIGAHSREDALHMLRDLPFTEVPTEATTFTDILDASVLKLRNEVESLSPKETWEMFHILWLEGDRALAAYYAKERLGKVAPHATPPSPSNSVVNAARWKDIFLGVAQAETPLEQKFSEALIGTDKAVPSPAELDHRAHKVETAEALRLARNAGSAMIVHFVQHRIDAENIRMFTRVPEKNRLPDLFLPGGHLSVEAYTAPHEDLINTFAQSAHHGQIIGVKRTELSPLALEHAIARTIAEDIRIMRMGLLGPEVLFAYAIRALQDLQYLRVLYTAKMNHLPLTEIRNLLPILP